MNIKLSLLPKTISSLLIFLGPKRSIVMTGKSFFRQAKSNNLPIITIGKLKGYLKRKHKLNLKIFTLKFDDLINDLDCIECLRRTNLNEFVKFFFSGTVLYPRQYLWILLHQCQRRVRHPTRRRWEWSKRQGLEANKTTERVPFKTLHRKIRIKVQCIPWSSVWVWDFSFSFGWLI